MNGTLRVTAAAVALALSLGEAPAYAADPDTEPPQIVSVGYSTSAVSVSGLGVADVTVNVRLTDNVGVEHYGDTTGVEYPFIKWGGNVLIELTLSSGTPQDGIWSGVTQVNSGWNQGANQVTRIEAGDGAGNMLQLDPRTVITVPTLTVNRSHHPELSIATNVVIPPTPFRLTVTARDGDGGKVWPGLKMHLTARAEVFVTNARGQVTISVPSTDMGADNWTAEVYGPPNPNQQETPISYAIAHFKIKFSISAAPAARTVPARTNVDVTGHLYPPAAQKSLHLQRLYGRTWRTVSDGADRSSGRFTLVATPPKGLSYYRVYVPGDAGSVGNTSATFTITGR